MKLLTCIICVVSILSSVLASRGEEPAGSITYARVLGVKIGMDLQDVMAKDVGSWSGNIGSPTRREYGTLQDTGPISMAPYDALLEPPEGFKYLGAPLKSLGLYFLPESGTYKVWCITFALDIDPSAYASMTRLVTKQFGEQTMQGGWSEGSRVLLVKPPEVMLVDIKEQRKAEVWVRRQEKK